MLVLFCRVIILYFLVFFVIRLTGKRQISELQPFDLCITLLIADMASVPATNTGVPLLYGIVPIVTLFLVQQLISFLSLKSESIRKAVCGQPLLLISREALIMVSDILVPVSPSGTGNTFSASTASRFFSSCAAADTAISRSSRPSIN